MYWNVSLQMGVLDQMKGDQHLICGDRAESNPGIYGSISYTGAPLTRSRKSSVKMW